MTILSVWADSSAFEPWPVDVAAEAVSPSSPPAACSNEQATAFAGARAASVMAGEVSLASMRDAVGFLLVTHWTIEVPADLDDAVEARRAAIRMIEDRGRRATSFREPRR
ncbi:hypothetical protein [Lichenibacterium dinghuense]|uniref:hypothetical protein n=1 Tax=Lichenibacterium dinghuense TaxID=2895977 RepID=UPI001F187D32|nr:hypothetical protein [Lichenibacterium sp. 6Y81]